MSISTTKDNSEDFHETVIEISDNKKVNPYPKNKLFKKKNEKFKFSNLVFKLIDKFNPSINESRMERKLNKISQICINYEKNIVEEDSLYRRLLAKEQFSEEVLPKIREVLPACEEEEFLLLTIRVCALTNRQKKERPEHASEIMQTMNEAEQRYHQLFDERNDVNTKKVHIHFSDKIDIHEIENHKGNRKKIRAAKRNISLDRREAAPTIDELSAQLNSGLNKVNKCTYHPAVLLFEDCIRNLSIKKISKDVYKQELQNYYFYELERIRLKKGEAELSEPLTLLDRDQTKKVKLNFKRLIESPLFDQWLEALVVSA